MLRDLTDKTILVTGASDGLGRAVALELAHRGASILVHGRDAGRADGTVEQLLTVGATSARGYVADFAELAQVARLAKDLQYQEKTLNVLINNAGLGTAGVRHESHDGHELVFQVDYLAPFLLTRLLLPLLERSAPSRIVNVASIGQAPIDFDDVMLKRRWTGVQAYSQAKLAQISMTFDMAEELRNRGVMITALHPATLMPTKLVVGRYVPQSTIEEGVRNVVQLAVDPSTAEVTGAYYEDGRAARASAQAYDLQARARLRDLSESLAAPYVAKAAP